MGFSESVIIFHPGSCHLYLGRATDPRPVCVPHLIARNRKPGGVQRVDKFFPGAGSLPDLEEIKRWRKNLLEEVHKLITDETVKLSIKDDLEEVISFNKTAKVVKREEEKVDYGGKPFLVGEAVFRGKLEGYNVHCPWRRGQMNVGEQLGGSATGVVSDLEDIWRWCLETKLGIDSAEFKNYKAVVVVPVIFDRLHAHHLFSMVVNSLGFQSCFFVQDHVAASFGAGLSTCTVADIGDQKISVSCVEDGVSYPQTRMELKYGGADLSVFLWHQLRITSFPVSTLLENDRHLVTNIKESYSHLNLSSWREPLLLKSLPGVVGVELLLGPAGLLFPEYFPSKDATLMYSPPKTVSDDPHDSDFLSDTVKRPKLENEPNPEQVPPQLPPKPPSSLEKAIIDSIKLTGSSKKLKSRLFQSIILTGGSSKFPGLPLVLSNRLSRYSPDLFPLNRRSSPSEEGSSPAPKVQSLKSPIGADEDPATVTWRGAALVSSLATSKELWISRDEWNSHGSKILREKSLFHF